MVRLIERQSSSGVAYQDTMGTREGVCQGGRDKNKQDCCHDNPGREGVVYRGKEPPQEAGEREGQQEGSEGGHTGQAVLVHSLLGYGGGVIVSL